MKLLDRMEAPLSQTDWLAGSTSSIADIGAVPFVKRIEEEIAPGEVTAWAKIQARPAFARARIGPFVD